MYPYRVSPQGSEQCRGRISREGELRATYDSLSTDRRAEQNACELVAGCDSVEWVGQTDIAWLFAVKDVVSVIERLWVSMRFSGNLLATVLRTSYTSSSRWRKSDITCTGPSTRECRGCSTNNDGLRCAAPPLKVRSGSVCCCASRRSLLLGRIRPRGTTRHQHTTARGPIPFRLIVGSRNVASTRHLRTEEKKRKKSKTKRDMVLCHTICTGRQ